MAIEAINAVRQVTQWLEKTVIDLNFCPFARKPFDRGGIHFSVVVDRKDRQVLEQLLIECQALVSKPEYDTTLMILSSGYDDFYRYLELLDMAQQLLIMEGYEGEFQLASFHPHYCFDGVDYDDASNFTNRSPYPLLHIIREAQLEEALLVYPNADMIPENNIQTARNKGSAYFESILQEIKK